MESSPPGAPSCSKRRRLLPQSPARDAPATSPTRRLFDAATSLGVVLPRLLLTQLRPSTLSYTMATAALQQLLHGACLLLFSYSKTSDSLQVLEDETDDDYFYDGRR
ncbi:hypothetical protein U9M48_000599 [Paspalum notatum var. saurae]|uniref:Uncharacterized protein n=1 Tax=Paspalum notatum var. saurae TaxID=547442 RepID=A0AAQ3PLT3_PASNO